MQIIFSHVAQRRPLLPSSLLLHMHLCTHTHVRINLKYTILNYGTVPENGKN